MDFGVFRIWRDLCKNARFLTRSERVLTAFDGFLHGWLRVDRGFWAKNEDLGDREAGIGFVLQKRVKM